MDEELTGLLDQLAADGAVAGLSDEDLAGHEEDLVTAAEAIDPATATAEDLDTLDRLATTVEAVRAERTTRTDAAATRASEAAERLARIRGTQPDVEATEGEQAEAEGEVVAEAEAAAQAAAEPQPVAAAARPAQRPAISRLTNRRPAQHAPRVTQPSNADRVGLRSITAGAGVPNLRQGDTLTRERAAEALADAASTLVKGAAATRPLPVVTFRMAYPEARQLHSTDAALNRRRLDAVMSPAAQRANAANAGPAPITAAGGFCAPAEVDNAVPTIVSAARPLRDSGATPNFQGGARRGRFRFLTSPQFGDYTGGVSAWTEADDISALDGSPTKPCVRIDCGDEITVTNEAIVKCLTVGNFFDRTYQEMVTAVLDIFDADTARFAEERHISTIATPAAGKVLAYTADELLGTTRNILSTVDRAIAAYQYIYRLPDSQPFRLVLPRWVRNQVSTDLAREMPGATAERLATDPGALERFLAARRNINVTWLMDGLASQRFANLLSGNTLVGWPDLVAMDLYPEGTWGQLDGGELNLGIVRSPELNAVNDLQIWAEFFEVVFWRGPTPSWHITLDSCPDGSTSAAIDISPCTTGS